jgi:hypothetical protein
MSVSLRRRSLRRILTLAALAAGVATGAQATTFRFDTDPFAGTTALETPGRQVIGDELFIPTFDPAVDQIEFDSNVFGVGPFLNTFTGFAANLPDDEPFQFIVLRTLDADNDPTNGNQMNAALAADLIAARLSTSGSGAGFFAYFNSALNLPRLVFSTDLSSSTADLKVLARFTGEAGQAGVDFLAGGNPRLAAAAGSGAVPEPAAWALMIVGFGMAGATVRRARRGMLAA